MVPLQSIPRLKLSQLNALYETFLKDYITIGDALKMGNRAVDELHPFLSNLMNNLNKIGSVESDHDSKAKIKEWYVRACVAIPRSKPRVTYGPFVLV